HHRMAINEMLQVVALCDDDVIVPVAPFDELAQFISAPKRADDLLLAILIPDYLLPARSHDAARHAFLVKNARISRSGFHVRLVAAYDPMRRVQDLASILNAGIAKSFLVVGR